MPDYDVIVIGSGIGGLTSASLLSKNGLKVLMLEQNSVAGGLCNTTSKDGYSFDTIISMLWGFGYGEVFHWLFSELNIFNDLFERESVIRKIEPGLQVILPNHRVNIYSERERFYEEMKREFPSDITNLVKLYQESDGIEDKIFNQLNTRYSYSLKNNYQNDSKRLKRFCTAISIFLKRNNNIMQLVNNWDNASEIERFIDLQLIYFIHKKVTDIPLPLLSVILGIPRRGIYGIQGGIRTLVSIMEKQLLRYGGRIIYNSLIEEIIIRKDKACGVKVRFEDSVNEIESRWVIADTSLSNIGGNLIKKKRKKIQFSNFIKKIGDGLVPFSVLLGVDEKVIPELMGEYVVMMRDYESPPEGNNVIFISASPLWDETRAPLGKRSITATYFIPANISANINWEKERENKKEEMINFLEQLIPFISEFIDCAYSITPDDYQRLAQETQGIIRPLNSRFFNRSSFKTPVRNLFIAGDNSFPCSCIAYTAKSGITVAERILKMS
ncbi:MAG: NAD(P)/FAD-dependent oxidoreductase [Nitrospinota bacterium]